MNEGENMNMTPKTPGSRENLKKSIQVQATFESPAEMLQKELDSLYLEADNAIENPNPDGNAQEKRLAEIIQKIGIAEEALRKMGGLPAEKLEIKEK